MRDPSKIKGRLTANTCLTPFVSQRDGSVIVVLANEIRDETVQHKLVLYLEEDHSVRGTYHDPVSGREVAVEGTHQSNELRVDAILEEQVAMFV